MPFFRLVSSSPPLLGFADVFSSGEQIASLATRKMSTTTSGSNAAPSNANAFLDAVKARRTAYAINSESPIPDARIQEIVETAVKHCPVRYCAKL